MQVVQETTLYNTLSIMVRGAISGIAAIWLHSDADLKIFGILICVDFIMGVLSGRINLRVKCRQIAGMVLFVGTAHLIYGIIRTNQSFPIDPAWLPSALTLFYSTTEAISIMRNMDAIGVSLPPKILDWLIKAEGLTGADKREIVALKLKQDQEVTALDLKITQTKEDIPTIIKP
jgi:phage-related holin